METSFYAYFIHYNGSGAPVLKKKSDEFQPGNRFSSQNKSEKIYLAGGFSSFTQQTSHPLSPTLQLNGDLANLSTDALQQIGLAEFNRLNATSYRSYTQEPDNRVVVLARNAASLSHFLETYGGVLEIEPLLIGSYHPEYNTADELELEAIQKGCRIQYMVRKPVDLDKCNYCAACGPVCPENCLDENLSIDMSRCNYCNECVKICPNNAIDLYRVEKYSLEFPALVLLDQVQVKLPHDLTHVYQPDSLEGLFSSLVPINVEETISWTSTCCQCSSRENTGCTTCLDACHHDALKLEQGKITINYNNCVECSACMASCPTGALQFLRFSDQQFINWFGAVQPKQNSTIILGNEQELHKLWWKRNLNGFEQPIVFLEYPNIRALTSMHLLFLLSLGANRIILLDDALSCQNKPIASQVNIANTIFSTLFSGSERITIDSSANLPNILLNNEPTPLKNFYHDFSFSNRRQKFGSLLSFLLAQSTPQDGLLSGEPFHHFGSIGCDDDLCTHCGACLNECHIEALTTESETLSLNHLGILCVQCKSCVDVCPENALTMKPGLLLAPGFVTQRELTRAEPISCLQCGKQFGTKKSYDRIVAILESQNSTMMENSVLEYCETCRVIKIFEAQQQ